VKLPEESKEYLIYREKIFGNYLACSTGVWLSGVGVRLVVGRLGFDCLAELDQKTLKVGIHNFPA